MFCFAAHAEDKLQLQYEYGNQIFGSYLKIYEDGKISHQERTCCPPNTNEIKEDPLKPSQLISLKKSISAASLGKILTKSCAGAMGERYGSFTVFTANEEYILRADRLSETNCIALYNAAPEITELEKLVYKYVKVQAPK